MKEKIYKAISAFTILSLLFFVAQIPHVHAAYSFVIDSSKATVNNNDVTTTGVDTSGADLIVIFVVAGGGTGGPNNTPTDSKSNTWTPLTKNNLAARGIRAFYSQNPTVGSGHTFTYSEAGSFPSIAMMAFSGSSASPFDVENTNNGVDVSSLTSGSVTPNNDNSLIVNATLTETTGSGITKGTLGSSYVNQGFVTPSGGNEGVSYGYIIQTSAAATNPTWTFDASNHVAITAPTVFKVGAAAAATPVNSPTLSTTTYMDIKGQVTIQ